MYKFDIYKTHTLGLNLSQINYLNIESGFMV